MTPLKERPARQGRVVLPAVACVGVAVLLGAAVITPRLTVFTGSASGVSGAADDQVFGPPAAAGAFGTGSCVPPTPLTPRQPRQPMIAPIMLEAARPARPALRALAASVTAGACDRADGRYNYVQTRQWALDGAAHDRTSDLRSSLLQYEHWLAADGSGRSIGVTARTPADENPLTDDTFAVGESLVDPAPLDKDPEILAARLDHIQPFTAGPQSVLRALADISQWQAPGRNVRAAVLTVLGDTDGLTYHGTVTDRAGRRGAAISAVSDNGGTRELIIIDPRTGILLAHEQAAMREPGALGITAPTVLSYTLYVAHAHTATVQQR